MFKLFALVFVVAQISAAPDKIVCYFGSWSTYRLDKGKFAVEDIETSKCTHIIYGFLGVNKDGTVRIADPYVDLTLGALKRFTDLKLRNANLKTLIAVGGGAEGSENFSKLVLSPSSRSVFINSIFKFMNDYNFDGIDMDWEYPAQLKGSRPEDKANFILLLKELRQAINARSGKRFLLTAAVPTTGTAADASFEVPKLNEYLDFINMMCYDYHGSYDGRTGQNAPMYPSSVDMSLGDTERNVNDAIYAWISRGASPQKLVLGTGFYGHSFTLANSANNGIGAATTAAGEAGPYTRDPGTLAYYEVCEKLNNGWTSVWDNIQLTPYAYKGNQWVGYDNVRSIKVKVQYAKKMNLGGMMLWSIDMDDFKGTCGVRYPLLSAIKEELGL